jgi:hypothetical protein
MYKMACPEKNNEQIKRLTYDARSSGITCDRGHHVLDANGTIISESQFAMVFMACVKLKGEFACAESNSMENLMN